MWEFFKPVLVDFQNPVIFALPVFALLMGIEVYFNYKDKTDHYIFKDSVASISMGIGSVFTDLVSKSFAFLAFSYIYLNFALFGEALSFTVLGWILLFFLDDFSFYWHHRLSHQVRILWASHVNHHSSEEYNLSTALRQSWTEVFYKYFFFMWLPLLGFHPLMILTQISINLIFQYWVHTKKIKRLPKPIEFIFNTPSHHRVHHGSNLKYLDKNHGGTLIIWDRMFGTFEAEDDNEPVIYGITTNINTYNPFKIATHEFKMIGKDMKKTKKWSDKLKYLLYPPGWSHDGSTKTVKEMLKEEKSNQ